MSEDVFTDMLEDDPEDELIENSINSIKSIKSNWQPIETAPKDGPILIAWGTKTTGLLGYDIVTYRHTLASTPRVEQYENQYSGFLYPERGYIILGWTPLPTFP